MPLFLIVFIAVIALVLVAAAICIWCICSKQGYTFAIDLNGISVCWLIRAGMTLALRWFKTRGKQNRGKF